MSLRLGALSEPLTSCIRAFNRATRAGGFKWGDTVVIQGSGPIGILAVAAAQEMGAGRVICVGAPEVPRLQLAKFGAEATVNIEECATPDAVFRRVREIVGGFGADLVMDCSGHPSAGPEGIEFLRDGGTMSKRASSRTRVRSQRRGTVSVPRILIFSALGGSPATICHLALICSTALAKNILGSTCRRCIRSPKRASDARSPTR